jgi:hypothetical protein
MSVDLPSRSGCQRPIGTSPSTSPTLDLGVASARMDPRGFGGWCRAVSDSRALAEARNLDQTKRPLAPVSAATILTESAKPRGKFKRSAPKD